jgi:deazaflavin-dependent oxidoreductase (nitroreductase family)
VLLLTTTGRKLGCQAGHAADLPTARRRLLVVVSNSGGDPPGWFLNLRDDPILAVQVKADHHTAPARAATAEEKPELYALGAGQAARLDCPRTVP